MEALAVKKQNGQFPDFSEIIAKSQTLSPAAIEILGSGKIKIDEVLMLVDSLLNYCRLGLGLVPIELSGTFVSIAVNLLYVALNCSFVGDSTVNSTLANRCLRIIEVADPTDPNMPGLWQCFLRLLATNTTFDDDARLLILSTLIKHIVTIISIPHPYESTKWFQFLRIALKLTKRSLQKSPFVDNPIPSIMKIVSILLPNDPLLLELLNLPMTSNQLREAYSYQPLNNIKGILGSTTFKVDSIGEALQNLVPEDLVSSIFNGRIPLKISKFRDFGRLNTWISLIFSNSKITEKESLEIFHFLSYLIISLNSPIEMALSRALLKRLIARSKLAFPTSSNLLLRLIYCSHATKSQMLGTSCRELFGELVKLWKVLPRNRPDILYWPLACMINFVKECPQPSSCSELLKIVGSLNNITESRLQSLCSSAIRVSLRYIETNQLYAVLSILPNLPPYSVLMILSAFPFVSSLDYSLYINKLLPSVHALLVDKKHDPWYFEGLRCCEIFLKFAPDLSFFERPDLTDLQPVLVSFLRREKQCIIDKEQAINKLKCRLDRKFDISMTVTLMDLMTSPTMMNKDEGPGADIQREVDRIIIELRKCLETVPNKSRVVNQLDSLLGSYR